MRKPPPTYHVPIVPSINPLEYWSWLRGKRPFPRMKGIACKWFVLIDEEERGNKRLLSHEHIHIDQQRRAGLFWYLWHFYTDEVYRAHMETSAYMSGSKATKHETISILTSRYNVSEKTAKAVTDMYYG